VLIVRYDFAFGFIVHGMSFRCTIKTQVAQQSGYSHQRFHTAHGSCMINFDPQRGHVSIGIPRGPPGEYPLRPKQLVYIRANRTQARNRLNPVKIAVFPPIQADWNGMETPPSILRVVARHDR
jgi:hypothetical protein